MTAPISSGATIKDGQFVQNADYYSADMIVSITRHRRAADDATYTYQFPLFAWKWRYDLQQSRDSSAEPPWVFP